MKIKLHNSATDLYFIGPNMWTNDRSKALDFDRMETAVASARQSGEKDLELVVSFPNVPDVRLPVAQVTAS